MPTECIGERPRRKHGTRNQRGEEKVLEAAATVLRRGLVDGDSAFTPGSPVWTAEAAAELERAFVDKPDLGPGSFLEKLRGQLTGCSPNRAPARGRASVPVGPTAWRLEGGDQAGSHPSSALDDDRARRGAAQT